MLKIHSRTRSGSVLILVVALLVLLALIGTAFITTAGNDRDAATQHKVTTQVELLVQGVKEMSINAVLSKVSPADFNTGRLTYRPAIPLYTDPSRPVQSPPTVSQVPKQFTNVDYLPWDAILAERVPSGIQPDGLAMPATGARWRLISASLLATNRDPADPNLFLNQYRSPLSTTVNPGQYSSRFQLRITSVDIPLPDGRVEKYPAFVIDDDKDSNYQKTVLAADTDGDGIADAGLFELPVGLIDGVRYYAAIRIIDNAAAINASVAWEHWASQFVEDNRLIGNFTPANVELRRLVEGPLNDGPDVGRFNAFQVYRQGGETYSNLAPRRDDGTLPYFQWATRYDAFYFGLGARLDNPGYNANGVRFQPLGVSESAALAYRFTLANPRGSQSILEQNFPNATRMASVNRKPFDPGDVANWYNTIFATRMLPPNQRPLRPWVVAHNPVSNAVPAFLSDPAGTVTGEPYSGTVPTTMDAQELQRNGQYRYRGEWASGVFYRIAEWVKYNGRSYVAMSNHTGLTPGTAAGMGSWAEAPWMNQPVKINPNTASFGSLMAAYWAVMADGPLVKPTGTPDAGYGGSGNTLWTFGDVSRPAAGGTTPLPPYHVKQLRAALAAVNTIDIRDQDEDVTSRTVRLTAMDGSNPIVAQVYGTERQPFITEAMVHIDRNDRPYVIIELYNPHEAPIALTAFRLAYRDRGTGAITNIGLLSGNTIAPGGYLYIENDASLRPATNGGNIAGLTPTPIAMSALSDVVVPANKKTGATDTSRELLILRTRKYNGTASVGTTVANFFDENLPTLRDLVPVDQLEFFDIAYGEFGEGGPPIAPLGNRLLPDPMGPAPVAPDQYIRIADRFHYRRSNGAQPSNRWHSVYSGPYNRTPASQERRQRGWVRDARPTAVNPIDESMLTTPGFGSKSLSNNIVHNDFTGAGSSSTFRTRTLQMNPAGSGGPWKGVVSANSGTFERPTPSYANSVDGMSAPAFPFGGFARTGDILQVTYVGGYRLDPPDPAGFAEMNSVTIDAVFADDGDSADDDLTGGDGASNSLEQLGRFCPIIHGTMIDDLSGKANPLVPQANHRYAWAIDLFDYFSVLSQQDDYYPNIDPTVGGDPTVTGSAPKWPGGDSVAPSTPQPVPNTLGSTLAALNAGVREDTAANHGLINLNTAPDYVIAQLPFTSSRNVNADIAFAIVTHRNRVGPFRSLFDLMKVQIPPLPYPAVLPPNGPGNDGYIMDGNWGTPGVFDPLLVHGDITPYQNSFPGSGGNDGVAGDFEARYLLLNRISNMVTFRSDSFTAYIIVQGWRNAGTSMPELVAQRRAAIIIDRSTVAPKLTATWATDVPVSSPTITNVPQN